MTRQQRRLLDSAIAALVEAVDTDSELWTERATGQDSEEAEESGYLVGYRDALEAVRCLLRGDPEVLRRYVSSVRAETDEWKEELEGVTFQP